MNIDYKFFFIIIFLDILYNSEKSNQIINQNGLKGKKKKKKKTFRITIIIILFLFY